MCYKKKGDDEFLLPIEIKTLFIWEITMHYLMWRQRMVVEDWNWSPINENKVRWISKYILVSEITKDDGCLSCKLSIHSLQVLYLETCFWLLSSKVSMCILHCGCNYRSFSCLSFGKFLGLCLLVHADELIFD